MDSSRQPPQARPWWFPLSEVGFLLINPVIGIARLLEPHPEVLTSGGAPILWLLIGLVFVLFGVLVVQSRPQDRAATGNTAAPAMVRAEPTWRKALRLIYGGSGVLLAIYLGMSQGVNAGWLILAAIGVPGFLFALRDLSTSQRHPA